jgi:hypothetical protein
MQPWSKRIGRENQRFVATQGAPGRVVQFVMARNPAWRDDEAIQRDRDECEASAATACFAYLRMNTKFVILNEGKNPRVAGGREHGFFPSFRMTGTGQAVHLVRLRKPRNGLLRRLAATRRIGPPPGQRCGVPFEAAGGGSAAFTKKRGDCAAPVREDARTPKSESFFWHQRSNQGIGGSSPLET